VWCYPEPGWIGRSIEHYIAQAHASFEHKVELQFGARELSLYGGFDINPNIPYKSAISIDVLKGTNQLLPLRWRRDVAPKHEEGCFLVLSSCQ
jgi:hypothetical protein